MVKQQWDSVKTPFKSMQVTKIAFMCGKYIPNVPSLDTMYVLIEQPLAFRHQIVTTLCNFTFS